MSRLTERLHSDDRDTRGVALLGRENGDGQPSGVTIDGVVYPLDGQPPVAASRGWGDMNWTRRVI